MDPIRDKETIDIELQLKDLETVEKKLEKVNRAARTGNKEAIKEKTILDFLKTELEASKNVRSVDMKEEKCLRKKVWLILADVVSAMAFCRRENAFFHRSVYRHAQALMWAPIFHDPETTLGQGSLCTVPANKSYHLRGLSGESCANSE